MRRPVSMILLAMLASVSGITSLAANPRDGIVKSVPGTQKVEGKRFTVEIEGNGPDVILIPGLPSPRAVWDDTRAALRGSYRLHIVQIRGFGDPAGSNAEGPVLEPFVAELAHYIDAGILKKGHAAPVIIGHSLGGLSALMIGSRHPASAGKVIVIDALPFIGRIFGAATVESIRPQAEALAAATRARANVAATGDDTDPGPNSQAGFLSKTLAGRTAIARWTRMADARVVGQALYDDMITDVRAELGKITAPLVVIYAEDASVMPGGMVDALYTAEYKGAADTRFVKIDDSRHFIMLDQPEKFQAALIIALAE